MTALAEHLARRSETLNAEPNDVAETSTKQENTAVAAHGAETREGE